MRPNSRKRWSVLSSDSVQPPGPRFAGAFSRRLSASITLATLLYALGLIARSVRAIPQLSRPPVWRVFERQLYFSGVESVTVGIAVGAALGLILVVQMDSLLGRNAFLSAKMLSFVMLRELGPLFAAIVLISRSATAMASELASMQVDGEIRQLEVGLGIPVVAYLLMPRVLGSMLSGVALSFYLQLGAILCGTGAVLMTGYNQDIPPVLAVMSLYDIAWSVAKSGLFGLWIGAIACANGMKSGFSRTSIPQAASRAVISAVLSVFILDGLLTLLMTAGEHGV